MGTLSYADEQALVGAVKEASAAVAAGADPTEAVAKVASDRRLLPGEIRLVCTALNNGRQTAQTAANAAAVDKFASFPLADSDAATAAVYGGPARKAAEPAEEPAEPASAKAASYVLPEPPARRRDPVDVLYDLRKAAAEARRAESAARSEASDALGGLVSYFKQARYDRVDFADFDAAARAYLGPRGKRAVDLLATHLPGEARCPDTLRTKAAFDTGCRPFLLLKAAVGLCEKAASAAAGRAAAEAELAAHEAGPAATFVRAAGRPKEAGDVRSVATYMALAPVFQGLRDRLAPEGRRPTGELVEGVKADLEDPAHENELRRIRARVMLNSLMTDPDDPVSGHSPEEVASAYNELAQAAPRSSELPAVMAPLLRRRLAGRFEPFEAKELVDIEKGVGSVRPDPDMDTKSPAAPRPADTK